MAKRNDIRKGNSQSMFLLFEITVSCEEVFEGGCCEDRKFNLMEGK